MFLLASADVPFDIFKAERQLIGIELLGPAAELLALQLLDDQAQLLDLAVTALLVRDEITDKPLQQLRIGWQVIEIDAHADTLRGGTDWLIRPGSIPCGFYWAVAEWTSSRALRSPAPLWHPPVHAFEQHAELGTVKLDNLAGRLHRRPRELPLLESL